MSTIFVVIDGMTDEEFSIDSYPNLAKIKEEGTLSYIQTIPEGFKTESLTGILSLLGVKSIDLPLHARGYFEALGANIEVEQSDLIFRATWVKIDEENIVTGFGSNDNFSYEDEFIKYYSLGTYKSIIILKNAIHDLPFIKTQEPHNHFGKDYHDLLPKGLDKLQKIIDASLNNNQILIPWGESVKENLPQLFENGCAICSANIVKGIARALKLEIISSDTFTGDVNTDILEKTKRAIACADYYDFVLLHFNGADEAAHRKNKEEKIKFIKQIDDICLSKLLFVPHDIIVTSDHATSPYTGSHSNLLQPFLKLKK